MPSATKVAFAGSGRKNLLKGGELKFAAALMAARARSAVEFNAFHIAVMEAGAQKPGIMLIPGPN